MRVAIVLALLTVVLAMPATAQQSASYKLNESVVNAGGRPAQGTVATSPSFRIRLDAIGEAAARTGPSSPSFHVDAGFVSAYPPPGETLGLVFTSKTALEWKPERSVGVYNLYRDQLSSLPGNYGNCFQASISGAHWSDPATPSPRSGWFYLVTAENRLREEGTKGYRSDGAARPNPAPCP